MDGRLLVFVVAVVDENKLLMERLLVDNELMEVDPNDYHSAMIVVGMENVVEVIFVVVVVAVVLKLLEEGLNDWDLSLALVHLHPKKFIF